MYPELRWDLDRTAALVKRELDAAGIPYEADKYGRNTIVVTINPQITRFTIGIRGDMDALPILENNHGKPYRSRNDGVMHACGHDAHTAMLIGTAKALWAIRDQLTCRVKLLFQPCGVCPTCVAISPVFSFTSVNMVCRLDVTMVVRRVRIHSSIASNIASNMDYSLLSA